MYDEFCIQNYLKQDVLSPLLFNFALEYFIRKSKKISQRIGTEWNTSVSGLC
jgi:hypothetical protein